MWPHDLGIPPFDVRQALLSLHRPPAVVVRGSRASAGEYAALLAGSRACLVPRGAGLHSYRLAEAVSCGCVPLVLSDGWVMPFEVSDSTPGAAGGRGATSDREADAPIVRLVPSWPGSRVERVPLAGPPPADVLATAANATWSPVRHDSRLRPRDRPGVDVTVGPYYLRLAERDWWAAPQVAAWAERSGELLRLRRRLPVAWQSLFREPVWSGLRALGAG